MMLRFVTIALLLAGGSNAILLRGMNRPDGNPKQKIRKLRMSSKSNQVKDDNDGFGIVSNPAATVPPVPSNAGGAAATEVHARSGKCLCAILCWQCARQGVMEGPCRTTCNISANPTTCVANCAAYMSGDEIRDDPVTNPPLPTDTESPGTTTELPATDPPTTSTTTTTTTTTTEELPATDPPATTAAPASAGGFYCGFCKRACASCNGGAPCRTVCEISEEPTDICDARCYDTMNLGEWGIP